MSDVPPADRAGVVAAVADAYGFTATANTHAQIQAGYERSMGRGALPAGIGRSSDAIAGVPGEWFRAAGSPDRTILYLHGGGYWFGSSRSHGPLAAQLALAAGAEVFVPNYRLAPEHPFPAGLNDARGVFDALMARPGAARRTVVVGDSAGGGLALALVLDAVHRGRAVPAAVVTMSAWADCSLSGESIATRADVDLVSRAGSLRDTALGYLAGADPRDPLVSPVFGDYRGCPPLFLQVGSDEMLHDDTQRVAAAARAAGVAVEVDVAPGMPHAFQILLWALPEARAAIDRAAVFVRSATLGT